MKTTLVVQILVIIAAYILQENVCQKTSSRQAPGPSHGNCTPAACKKTCEEKEPDKVLLETSCPASYICHCTYQEDCTEDICSAYCKETYPPEELLESKCIDNFCYCNRTTKCSEGRCRQLCQEAEPGRPVLNSTCDDAVSCSCVYRKVLTDQDRHRFKAWGDLSVH